MTQRPATGLLPAAHETEGPGHLEQAVGDPIVGNIDPADAGHALLRTIDFPRGARKWIALSGRGIRAEYLDRGGRFSRRVGPGDLVELETCSSKGLAALSGVQVVARLNGEASTALMALSAWLLDLIESGLAHDDPHPELFALIILLHSHEVRRDPVSAWGELTHRVARAYGVWAASESCACDAPRAIFHCDRCVEKLGGVLTTPIGRYTVSVARLIDAIEAVWREQFGRRLVSADVIREYGRRGLLT